MTQDGQTPAEPPPPGVDLSRPNTARIYDKYLGGTHNFPVDEQVAAKVKELSNGDVIDAAWANRAFLTRTASWMATIGIDQFLDIGAGLPTQNNTHDVVHAVRPGARVVYVDHDPEAVAYGRHLVAGLDAVHYIRGDVTDPDGILNHPTVRQVIDFSQPVGLLLVGLLYFVPTHADPWVAVARLVKAIPPSSFVALSHLSRDYRDENLINALEKTYDNVTDQISFRTRAEIERFFAGLKLLPPYEGAKAGLAPIGQWGAEDPTASDDDGSSWLFGGVGQKPNEAE